MKAQEIDKHLSRYECDSDNERLQNKNVKKVAK